MSAPSIRELIEFRERYGLEAYLVWCCACIDLPAWALLNLLRIGRHFGPLAEDRYDRQALVELVRRPDCSGTVREIISRSESGEHVSLEMVRKIVWAGPGGMEQKKHPSE